MSETLAAQPTRQASPILRLLQYEAKPPIDEVPLVIEGRALEVDEFIHHQSDRFIGKVLVDHEVVVGSELDRDVRIDSLKDAIHYGEENSEADALVEVNVLSDAIERTIKVGHIRKAKEKITDTEQIHQHGHTNEQIQANALASVELPQMLDRVKAETRNAFRKAAYNRMGLLDDHLAVVLSLVGHDSMTMDELQENNFFIDTMSLSVQATTKQDNELVIEAAFMAGIKEPGAELHDMAMVDSFVESLGMDWKGRSTLERLDNVLLIPKSLAPNGLIDVIRMLDDHNGGTFFGQAVPRQDYLEFQKLCEQRELDFLPKVQAIKSELYARKNEADTNEAAAELLDEVSEKHMVERAVEDESIDPKVFGPAAPHIVAARYHRHVGNYELERATTLKAINTAESGSCPGGRSRKELGGDLENSFGFEDDQDEQASDKKNCKEVKDGDAVTCPYCSEKVKAVVPQQGGRIYCSNKQCKEYKASK